MDLPIDHFRLLGVGPASDAHTVLRTLAQRLERSPEQAFTSDTLQARARLLRDSADLLSDPERRRAYEMELTALSGVAAAVPALEVPSSLEVAGLLLLLEAGQPLEVFELACRCLQPPQAPALGSFREADLTLVAALACLAGAEDCRSQRRFEAAARLLQQGLQLLQRMGQVPELRQRMGEALDRLTPYLVLDLLSRDLSAQEKRSEGLALLEQLVQRRGGLEGQRDPGFSSEEFQAFFKQIRSFLTVQEQVDLFSRWAQAGSDAADFLLTTALTASGFAQRKPERIAAARDRLLASGRHGIEPLLANLHLLLGEVDAALETFEAGAGPEIREWAARQDREPLGQLCAYCRDWLQRDVLPGYRDLDADPDLEAYFSDRDVIRWVEREDRRAGRFYAAPSPAMAPPGDVGLIAAGVSGPSAVSAPSPAGSEGFDWGLSSFSSPFSSTPGGNLPTGPAEELEEELSTLRWPGFDRLRLSAMQEHLAAWRSSAADWRHTAGDWRLVVADWPPAIWLGAAAALGLVVVGSIWLLRPRPAANPSGAAAPLSSKPVPPPAPVVPAVRPVPAPPRPLPAATDRPAATNARQPLTVARPSLDQLRNLLRSWLDTKAAVLAGAELPADLEAIARPEMVDRLRRERQSDAALEQRQTLEVSIGTVSIQEQDPGRIALAASLSYSDRRLDAGGRELERTQQKVLNNVYIFGRDQGRWRLVAVQASP